MWLLQSLTWILRHPRRASELLALETAILRNPALPFDILGRVLLMIPTHRWSTMGWYNPAVPLLLLKEPSPLYREAAERLLAYESGVSPSMASLDRLVHVWALRRTGDSSRDRQTRSLARHLAGLFGLPWPASPDSTPSG